MRSSSLTLDLNCDVKVDEITVTFVIYSLFHDQLIYSFNDEKTRPISLMKGTKNLLDKVSITCLNLS